MDVMDRSSGVTGVNERVGACNAHNLISEKSLHTSMARSVAARVNDQVADWIEKKADSRATTKGRIVEQILRDAYQNQSESGSSEDAEESLPQGVYVPNSDKHDYAVKYIGYDGDPRRKYYKTRKGAEKKAARVKENTQQSLSSV